MTDDEALGALVIATKMRGQAEREWLRGVIRSLNDAGYEIVPLCCDQCGRSLSSQCAVHGQVGE